MFLHVDLLCNFIIQIYFTDSRCLFVFTDVNNTFEYTGNMPIVNVQSQDANIYPELFLNHFGCQAVLIKSDHPVTIFRKYEEAIRWSMERFIERKILIVAGSNPRENVSDIFFTEEIKYIADLVIIQPELDNLNRQPRSSENNENYELWTHKYVGVENNNEALLLDIWCSSNQSFKFNNNLFPDKLKNQMGRVLRLGTMHYVPYDIVEGFSEEEYTGCEILLLRAFLKYTNTTSQFSISPPDFWGEIFPNFTGNGLLGVLVADQVDFAMAAMGLWYQMYQYLDLSATYVRSGVTCIVPAPQLAAGWLTPLFSYSDEMWSLVGTSFIACAFAHFLLCVLQTKHIYKSTKQTTSYSFGKSMFTIFKIFLTQCTENADIPPGRNGIFFIGVMFIYSLFLSSTYSSGLSTVMTIPRYDHPINTVEDLLNSGLPWVSTDKIWVWSIAGSDVPIFQAIVDDFLEIPSDEILREKTKTREYTYATERLPQGTFAIPSFFQEDVIENFRVLKEDLYFEQLVIVTRKSSVILPIFNKFVQTVFETGFIPHWQDEALLLFGSHMQRAIQSSNQKGTVGKLKWTHVEGAFGILILGHVLSFAVFLFEITFYRFSVDKYGK